MLHTNKTITGNAITTYSIRRSINGDVSLSLLQVRWVNMVDKYLRGRNVSERSGLD